MSIPTSQLGFFFHDFYLYTIIMMMLNAIPCMYNKFYEPVSNFSPESKTFQILSRILMTSDSTPIAVTSAPAPAPCIMRALSPYLFV